MKLSTVFELLLIFLIISFAASKYVGHKEGTKWRTLLEKSVHKEFRKERQASPNRYCNCSNLACNCCRDFSLPVVPVISGPGCASLKYLQGDSMLVTMKFGDRVLRNVTISGKKPKPICMGLPGGISQFCGRIYDIARDKDELRACLGLELRSQDDVEASLRVSCFKLGPRGLNVEPGRPVPNDEDDDDDDDDDDDFGFPGDDDDDNDDDGDDDDDDVFGLGEDDDNESENAVESGEGDYTGFSALSDEFLESFFESDSNDKKKKPTAPAAKPQSATLKPQVPSTVSANRAKPQRVVTNKLVPSTPSKVSTTQSAPIANASPSIGPTTVPSHVLYTNAAGTLTAETSVNKVYVSPLQYKPTEKIRPQPNQPLESYIPTMAQLPIAEKVYTSPQQISTDKVYLSTTNMVTENYVPMEEEKESLTGINYYIPTTQQFQSTERIYLPANLSTTESSDFEPVTSTSMTVNILQSVDQNNTVERLEKPVALPMVQSSATEVPPDSEYNEVDSDVKTTINEIRLNEISTIQPTVKVEKIATTSNTVVTARTTSKRFASTSTTQSSAPEDEDDDEDLSEMVDTAASVFGTDEQSTKETNNKVSEESEQEGGLEDSDEDSEEGIVLGTSGGSNNDYGGDEAEEEGVASIDDDDDDDDEYRKFKSHTKATTVTSVPQTSSTSSSATVHNGREHKRMNLPPLFSQSPEISSYWSSGGHVYKIRMSPLIQEPATILQNPNRLGRLNLFVPALESNPLTGAFVGKQPTTQPTSTNSNIDSNLSSEKSVIPHRFSLADIRNQTAPSVNNRSNRNHKRMRMPRTDLVR